MKAFIRSITGKPPQSPEEIPAPTTPAIHDPALPGFERVAALAELPPQGLHQYIIRETLEPVCIVTAKERSEVHAMSDVCPHKRGLMSLGDIEESDEAQGLCVKCPRHRKKFNGGLNFRVSDGQGWCIPPTIATFDPTWKLPLYDVQIKDGYVFVAKWPRGHEPSKQAPTAPLSTAVAPSLVPTPGHPSLAGYERVAALADLPAQGLTQYIIQATGTPLCIVTARDRAEVHALYDLCPHKAGVMSEGDIEDSDKAQGLCVKCPRHRKKFNGGLNFRVGDGQSWCYQPCEGEYNPSWHLSVHDIQVVDGSVYVSIQPRHTGGEAKQKEKEEKKAAAVVDASGITAEADAAAVGSAGQEQKHLHISAGAAAVAALEVGHYIVHSRQRKGSIPGAAASPIAPPGFVKARLAGITAVSHDTNIYRLVPAEGEDGAAAAAGLSHHLPNIHSWHVVVQLGEGPLAIEREYTPISPLHHWLPTASLPEAAALPPLPGGRRYLDLLIKLYAKGQFTGRLAHAKVGDSLYVSPPEPTLLLPQLLPPGPPVQPKPTVTVDQGKTTAIPGAAPAVSAAVAEMTLSPASASSLLQTAARKGSEDLTSPAEQPVADASLARPYGPGQAVALVAGGTGITPMLQIITWALGSTDFTAVPERVFLLACYRTAAEVLGVPQIAALKAAAGDRLQVLVALTRASEAEAAAAAAEGALGLPTTTGRVSGDMVKRFFPPAPAVQRVVVSGPEGMWETVKAAMDGAGHGTECLVELEA